MVPANVRFRPDGERECRACMKAARPPYDPSKRIRVPRKLATHCQRGHAFDEANTFYTPDGWRNCRACSYEAQRRHRARKRALALASVLTPLTGTP